MFGAYFDDSATPGSNPSVLTMACYVASDTQWDAFKPRWQEMLDSEGLEYLHMAELTFRHDGQRVGAYKDWTDEREAKFQERAHAIIHETVEYGTAMSVNMHAYQKAVPVGVNELLGGPHGFCVFMCLLKLNAYAKQHRWTGQVVCTYESGSGYGKEITALQQNIRKNPVAARQFGAFQPRKWGFTDKLDAPQLQAADVLAYESNHFWYDMFISHDPRQTKKSLQNLLRTSDKHWGNYFNEAKLKTVVRTLLL